MKNSTKIHYNTIEIINDRNLTIVNLTIVTYFALNYLIYIAKIQNVILGVINELATLPMLFLQIVFLVLGTIHIIKKPINFLLIISLLLLTLCSILTFSGFIN